MRKLKLPLLMLTILNLSGCMTLTSLDDPCPYNGLRAGHEERNKSCIDIGCVVQVPVGIMTIVDTPFSAVLDTALLPIQSVRYLFKGDRICGSYNW